MQGFIHFAICLFQWFNFWVISLCWNYSFMQFTLSATRSCYPNLFNCTKDIFQIPGISSTVNMEKHIKLHYYGSQPSINPFGNIAVGPNLFNILILILKLWYTKRLTLRCSTILPYQLLIKSVIFSCNLFNLIKTHFLMAN